jgi:hypothetical protein
MLVNELIEKIRLLSDAVRYIAIYVKGELHTFQKQALEGASSSESDKYEEIIVNPVLLKLVTQRGNIDCGGARYVLIRYGNFFEFVMLTNDGHVSVGIQPDIDALEMAGKIEKLIKETGLA